MEKVLSKNNENLSVSKIPGIGEKKAKAFEKLSIDTLEKLIHHYPRSYENRGNIKLLRESNPEEKAGYILTVATEPETRFIRKNMTILKFRAFDNSGSVYITFFNQTFLKNTFKLGSTYRFFGKVEKIGSHFQMASPTFEEYFDDSLKELPPLYPIYPLTEGITQKNMSTAISYALKKLLPFVDDYLNLDLREENHLCSLQYALQNIHTPKSYEDLWIAKNRLIFDELFIFSLAMLYSSEKKKKCEAPIIKEVDLKSFYSSLEFSLTSAQARCVGDILRDMNRDVPMGRILVGDVGSGKTVCAVIAAYTAAKNGYQTAVMVPTEVLARQHYRDFVKYLEPLGVNVALLVGDTSAKEKKEIYSRLANYENSRGQNQLDLFSSETKNTKIDVVIGTQALISEGVSFCKLGLVITDEQHRFGVNQRAALNEKSRSAHVLVMSATPIPRTLSLVMYSDLDMSVIDEMPAGRMRVDTFVVNESYRERLNGFIRKEVMNGGQVYIVCPSIEEVEQEQNSEASGEILLSNFDFIIRDDKGIHASLKNEDFQQSFNLKNQSRLPQSESQIPLKAAISYANELANEVYPDLSVACLHGKMKNSQKEEIMKDFSSGKINILVSTTVIEVGVNVPNATLMIVENSERFGLSQLHQLRGRVGRGSKKSYCILVSEASSENTKKRLEIMKTTYDGFKIAMQDLELRGPGDFLSGGSAALRQHGGMNFKIASLANDMEILTMASNCAKEVLEKDKLLELPENHMIKEKINDLFETRETTIN